MFVVPDMAESTTIFCSPSVINLATSFILCSEPTEGANEIINRLEAKYKQHVNELYTTDEYKQKTQEFIKAQFDYIRSYTKDIFTLFEEKVILAQGELISTNMVTNYLQEQGVNAILLPDVFPAVRPVFL